MKKSVPFLALLTLLLSLNSLRAQQYVYSISTLNQNAGNPGGLNADNDTIAHTVANGFTQIIGPSLTFPTYSPVVSLPFNFMFNGQMVNRFCVSTTGILTFDTTKAGALASPVAGTFTGNFIPSGSIAAFWSNSPVSGTGANDIVAWKVYGSAPNRQVWVDWYSYAIGNATDAYFSVVLEEGTNAIYVVDKRVFTGTNSAASVGIKFSSTQIMTANGTPNLSFTAGTAAPSDNNYYAITYQTIQSTTDTIGRGTALNPATGYPSVYGNNYWGAKHQFLIKKSELGNMVPNPFLSSLAFNVQTLSSATAFNNFSIKLKNTNLDSLTGFVSGATQVYTNAAYSPTTGWNNHVFSNYFQWDTTKNLIVEVCFNNTAFVNNNTIFFNTTQPFRCTAVFRADNNNNVCNAAASAATADVNAYLRPNMLMTGLMINMDLLPPSVNSVNQILGTCNPGPKTVNAQITDNKGVLWAKLIYSINNGTSFDTVAMSFASGQWSGQIPTVSPAGTPVQYAVFASDTAGNVSNPTDLLSYTDGLLTINLGPDQNVSAGASTLLSPGNTKMRGLKITEVILSRSTQFASQQQTVWPSYLPATTVSDEIVEIQNVSGRPMDISGYTMTWYVQAGGPGGAQAYNVIFPIGTTIPAGKFAFAVSGNGISDTVNRIFSVGTQNANAIQTAAACGFILKDSSGNIIDVVAANSYAFAGTTGVTAANWSGNIPSSNQRSGLFRIAETNTAADWVISNSAPDTTSIGYSNPRMQGDFADYVWRTLGGPIFSYERDITVSPTLTTTYVLNANLGSCTLTDSITLNVLDYCHVATGDSSVYVGFVKINNVSKVSGYSANGYSLTTTPTVNVLVNGVNNVLQMMPGYHGQTQGVYYKVWIDWNKDGDMNDQGETLLASGPDSTLKTISFSTPSNAVVGTTRLRLGVFASDTVKPCDSSFVGEFEDYLVSIKNPSADTSKPSLFSMTRVIGGCAAVARNIQALWTDNYPIDSVKLVYSLNGGTTYSSVNMTWTPANNLWTGTLPAGTLGTKVLYYSVAKDFSGNQSTGATYSFTDGKYMVNAGNDTIFPPVFTPISRVASVKPAHFMISEVLVSRNGAGIQQAFPAPLPQNGFADMIEIANFAGFPADLSGYTLKAEVFAQFGPGGGQTQTATYTFPVGTVLKGGQVAVVIAGNGTNVPASRVFYIGNNNNNLFTANGNFAVSLTDPNNNVTDLVIANGYNPSAAFGATAADFSGTLPVGNIAGIIRNTNREGQSSSDWTASAVGGTLTSLGNFNTGLTAIPATFSWKNLNTSAVVSATDTLNTSVSASTSFEVSFTIDSCVYRDTFNISTNSNYTDLAVTRLVLPSSCYFGTNETVGVVVKNVGFSPVTFSSGNTLSVVVKANGVGMSLPITSGTLNFGDSITYNVSGINLSSPSGQATNYLINGEIQLLSDAVQANNLSIDYLLTSDSVVVNAGIDQTIAPAGSATLTASTSYEKVLISEIMQSRTNTGTQAAFPAQITIPGGGGGGGGAPDVFELTNVGPNTLILNGYQFVATLQNGQNVVQFNIPNGTVLPSDSILTIIAGTGTSDSVNRYFYTQGATNNPIASANQVGYTLLKNGVVVDALAVNGYAGLNPQDFSGTVNVNGFAGCQRIGKDNNTASNWVTDAANLLSTIGSVNQNLSMIAGTSGWKKAGTTAFISTQPTAVVSPTATSSYVYSINVGNCSYTDTVVVNVSTNFIDLVADSLFIQGGTCSIGATADVSVRVRNIGLAAANFTSADPLNVTAKLNNGTPQSLAVTGSLAAGASNIYTVTGVPVANLMDWVLNNKVQASISFSGDANATNNTAPEYAFGKYPTGVFAGNDTTVQTGSPVNLKAISTKGSVVISEVFYSSFGQGAQQTFPSAITNNNASFIEISNFSTAPVNLAGYVFQSVSNTAAAAFTYTLPSSAKLEPGQVLVLASDAGTDDTLNRVYFMNLAANPYFAGGGGGGGNRTWGMILKNGSNIIDAVSVNGYNFTLASGVTTDMWSGTVPTIAGRSAFMRKGFDTNTASDWSYSATNQVSSIGTFNTGLRSLAANYLWFNLSGTVLTNTSSLIVSPTSTTTYVVQLNVGGCVVNDTITVSMAAFKDVEMMTFNTPTNVPYNTPTTISVKLKNNGNQPVNGGFKIYLTDGTNLISVDTVTSLIPQNGIIDLNYSTPWNPSSAGMFMLTAYHDYSNDVNHNNDTVRAIYNSNVSVQNLKGNQVSVYPNPTQSVLYINATFDQAASTQIVLRDVMGRVVRTEVLGTLSDLRGYNLEVSDLMAGMYWLQIQHGNENLTTTRIQILK